MPWVDNRDWDDALESGADVVLSARHGRSSCSGRAS